MIQHSMAQSSSMQLAEENFLDVEKFIIWVFSKLFFISYSIFCTHKLCVNFSLCYYIRMKNLFNMATVIKNIKNGQRHENNAMCISLTWIVYDTNAINAITIITSVIQVLPVSQRKFVYSYMWWNKNFNKNIGVIPLQKLHVEGKKTTLNVYLLTHMFLRLLKITFTVCIP